MEDRKSLKTMTGILVGMLLIPLFNISAYDAETTHPGLVQETIKLFEYYYPQHKFTEAEKALLEKGGIEEDNPAYRSLFHFYDPIYERGLWGNMPAKEWAENTEFQALFDPRYTALLANISQKLFESRTDFTFERAVFDYVHNDKERALESLGHILHLIEDMAVPAHVRNDAHPPVLDWGSPFEDYAQYWTKDKVDMASELIENGKRPITYDNLKDYFNDMALFANQNFFSKDTILIERYAEPTIACEETEILSDNLVHKFGFNNKNARIVEIKEFFNFSTKKLDKIYIFEDKDKLIFLDNWNALSKQTVLNGAGIIKLFFDEVEKEKESLALLHKNESYFSKIARGVSGIVERVEGGLSQVDPQDMLASAGEAEKEDEGDLGPTPSLEGSDQNRPTVSPEDSDSPELKRLALILREAEKMVARLEESVSDLEEGGDQNVGGTVEVLIEDVQALQTIAKSLRYYGGGGGSAPISPQSAPDLPESTEQNSDENDSDGNNNDSNGNGGGGTAAATPTTTPTAISPPQITNPTDFSQIFTASTIDFAGTASSTQIIFTDFSNATTTADQNGVWRLTLSDFAQGTTTVNFFAGDSQGNATSTPTTISLFIDSATPDAPLLKILQCDNSFASAPDSCLITTTTLGIHWSAAPSTATSDITHFNIEQNGVFATTTATSTQITNLQDSGTYTFSVAVVGANGNASATTTKTAIISATPIVINEIAWAGTDASTADEWIELYNRSNKDINLSDWILYSQDGAPFLNLSGTLSAGGYYLIERTDDETVSDISADLVVPFSGWTTSAGLGNTGEHLILAYKKPNQATTTIDEVFFASSEGGWVDKNNTCSYGKCRTLERYNPNYICTNISDCRDNWGLSVKYSASYDLLNGLDADNEIIRGTPKARNSLNYKIAKGAILNADKTLTASSSPYFVGADGLIIAPNATLSIEPGVVIKIINRYGNAEITVKGSIQANGAPNEPIIFTTFGDDTGGDTNGDGVCVSGVATSTCPGEVNNFWSQIILFPSSQNSYFNNTIFRYGGDRLSAAYPTAMVIIDGVTANFTESAFENSRTSGAYFKSATSIISNCIFQNNKTDIAYNEFQQTYYNKYYGLIALNGNITVQNSNFNHNQVGLGLFDTVGAMVDSNIFNNHTDFPVIVSSSPNVEIKNNSGENNAIDGIKIFGCLTNENATTTLAHNSLPYILDKTLTVAENTALEIGPKTIFKFDSGGYLTVNGYLEVNGGEGETNKILFTSLGDDGETATSTIPKQGGISLHSATSTIENAEFRYLDRALSYIDKANYQNVASFPSPIDLKDVVFKHNTWSIFADPSDTSVIRAENVSCDPGTTNTTGICQ